MAILAEVVSELVAEKVKESQFMSVGSDGSEACKTRDEKEMVYGKVVCRGDFGVKTPVFLLACKALKDFGGANVDGVFNAMSAACSEYLSESEIKEKVACIVADGASTNFGQHNGALTQFTRFLGWKVLLMHCMNHRLELEINDSFQAIPVFKQIKEMMGQIFRLFRNSGKNWRVFQLLSEKLEVFTVRFTKPDGTRFQAHVYLALHNFLRNFLMLLLFAENAEEAHGLVTAEMKLRLAGYRRKWVSYEFLGACHFFQKVLKETKKLSLLMEKDSALIYELHEAVVQAEENIGDLKDESCDLPFPACVNTDGDECEIEVSCLKEREKHGLQKLTMSASQREAAEKNISVVKESFKLNKVRKSHCLCRSFKQPAFFYSVVLNKLTSRLV